MATFCTKCGKELKDGKCAKCDKEIEKEVKVEKEETTAPSADIEDIKNAGKDCINAIKNIFTKPFDAIKEFVSDNKVISGVIMILVAAASHGLYYIATLKSTFDSTGSKYIKEPDYLNEFFEQAGPKLAIYALLAVAAYIIITKVLKGKATLKQIITAVGISLSVVILANLVNSGLVFIDEEVVDYIRGYITSFGYIFSILTLYYGVKEVAEVDKNKLFLSIASMSIIATACWDIIDKIIN